MVGDVTSLGLLVTGAVSLALWLCNSGPTVVQMSLAAFPALVNSSFVTGCEVVVDGGLTQD